MSTHLQRLVPVGLLLSVWVVPATTTAQGISPSTPAEFVATYDSLATAILATKQTEQNLVRSILSTTYAHAGAARARAELALQSGDQEQAQQALEELAGHAVDWNGVLWQHHGGKRRKSSVATPVKSKSDKLLSSIVVAGIQSAPSY